MMSALVYRGVCVCVCVCVCLCVCLCVCVCVCVCVLRHVERFSTGICARRSCGHSNTDVQR